MFKEENSLYYGNGLSGTTSQISPHRDSFDKLGNLPRFFLASQLLPTLRSNFAIFFVALLTSCCCQLFLLLAEEPIPFFLQRLWRAEGKDAAVCPKTSCGRDGCKRKQEGLPSGCLLGKLISVQRVLQCESKGERDRQIASLERVWMN